MSLIQNIQDGYAWVSEKSAELETELRSLTAPQRQSFRRDLSQIGEKMSGEGDTLDAQLRDVFRSFGRQLGELAARIKEAKETSE